MKAVEYTLLDEYTDQQLHQIMLGMKQNVDVIQYADPRYSDWQMEKIREALLDELDVTILLDHRWDNDMTSVLQFALYDGLDLSHYADYGFTANQIQEIHKGLLRGVDVKAYTYKIYRPEQMAELRQALEDGVDILLLNDPRYSPETMRLLRVAAKDGYNIEGKFDFSMTHSEIGQALLSMANERAYARYMVSRELKNIEHTVSSEKEVIEVLKNKGYSVSQDENTLLVTPPNYSASVEIEHSEVGYSYVDETGNKVYYSLPFWQSEEFDFLWQRVGRRDEAAKDNELER